MGTPHDRAVVLLRAVRCIVDAAVLQELVGDVGLRHGRQRDVEFR